MARRRARPGPAAQVDDLGRRREEDPPAARAERGAEVDVLGVEKEPLVEQPHRLGIRARDEQARAADPVHVLLAPGRLFDPLRDRRDARARAGATVAFWRSSRAARSSGRTTAPRGPRRRPGAGRPRPRPGARGDARPACRCAPRGTTVSLLSRSSRSPRVARMPALLPAAKPRLRSSAMHADTPASAAGPPPARGRSRRCRRP